MPRLESHWGDVSSHTLRITAYESSVIDERRTWNAILEEHGKKPRSVIIHDPDNPKSYLQHDYTINQLNTRESCEPFDDLRRERRIQIYCNTLAASLGLPAVSDESGPNDVTDASKILEIHVSDAHTSGSFSIHSLMWELLEHRRMGLFAIQIVHTVGAPHPPSDGLLSRAFPKKPFHILLVVSRSYQNNGYHFTDLSPTLIYDTLCHLSKILSQAGRPFAFRVVFPGTLNNFQDHLEKATASNVTYDLIHFDMHGRIATSNEPELLFTRQCYPASSNVSWGDTLDFSETFFEALGAHELGELLQKHRITTVVLNSCHSAYAQRDHQSNLCLRLMQYGVERIVGMNFAIRGTSARLYFQSFYTSLLVSERSIESSAADGRESVRLCNTEPLGDKEHDPSTLPHVYVIVGGLEKAASKLMLFQRLLDLLFRKLLHLFFGKWLNLELQKWLTAATLWEWFVVSLWSSVQYLPCVKAYWDATDTTYKKAAGAAILFITLKKCFPGLYHCLLRKPKPLDPKVVMEDLRSGSSNPWQGIGMMIVEDRLKLSSSVFIEMPFFPMTNEWKRNLQSAIEAWECTQSVKVVTVVSGEELFSPLWYWKHLFKCKFSTFQEDLEFLADRLRLMLRIKREDGLHAKFVPPPPSRIIFTDFDFVFHTKTKSEDRNRVLGMISSARDITFKTRHVDLLFIGSGGVPWESGDIDPDVHPWANGPKLCSRDLDIDEKI